MLNHEHPSSVISDAFVGHFAQFGAQFQTASPIDQTNLSLNDMHWLEQVGLPNEGIPFLYFDTLIAELRDVHYHDDATIIGTAFDVTSRDYVVIDPTGQVMIRCLDDRVIFVNSSVEQLFLSIYAYSDWLSDHEALYMTGIKHSIDSDAIFDLYCRLRDIDRLAFNRSSLWPEVVHADHQILVEMDNMDHPV